MSVDVILTPAEIMMAAQAGIMRQVENIKTKAEPYYGASNVADWQLHIEGCLGEFALAKYLNVWWGGKGWIKAEDGKKPEYWKEHVKNRPAFFVPQSALKMKI